MKNKKLKIALIIIFAVLAIALLVCYILFKEQTTYYFNCVKDFINKPLPIVGVSIAVIAYFVYRFLKETRFGRKIFNEFKRQLEEKDAYHKEKESDLEQRLKIAEQRIEVVEARAKKSDDKLARIAQVTKNVKIQAILKEDEEEANEESSLTND